jgi:competence protein ComEC
VLRIQGAHHNAVLTGDIGQREEQALVDDVGQIHVALAAHHGSASSSSQAWVDALGAWHVISKNGYRNRFNHPAPVVQRRWRRAHAAFWRTDFDGAVQADSSTVGLRVFGWRDRRQRYWHEPLTLHASEQCSAPINGLTKAAPAYRAGL